MYCRYDYWQCLSFQQGLPISVSTLSFQYPILSYFHLLTCSSYDNPHLGSFHGDDLQAFFGSPANSDQNDLALFEAMREYFTSFVTTGTPRAKNGVTWEVCTSVLLTAPAMADLFVNYQSVSSPTGSSRILFHPNGLKMEVIDDALNTRCNFWHGIDQEIQT